jgi:hypothetical protein
VLIYSVAGSYRVFGLNLTGESPKRAHGKTQFETTLPLLMPLISSTFMFAADVKTCRDPMEINDQLKKLKKPSYLGWFIFRVWLALACGVIGVFSYESSGAINVTLWILLGAQFLIDGDLIMQYLKLNRGYIVVGLFILILLTT